MFKSEFIHSVLRLKLSNWKHSAVLRFLLFIMLAPLFYYTLASNLIPKTYDIEKHSTAERTIYAPNQTENKSATEKKKEEAAQAVQPVYLVVSIQNAKIVELIFEKLRQINFDTEVSTADKVSIYRAVLPSIVNVHFADQVKKFKESERYNEQFILEVERKLQDQQYRIPEEAFFKFPRLTKEDIDAMEPVARDIVNKLMTDQINDAQIVRAKVAELINASPLSKVTTRELVQEIVRVSLTANRFYDEKGTEQARIEAREQVEPIYVHKNEVIVEKGQVITEEIYEQLSALKLLKTKTNYWPQLGLWLLVALFITVLFMYIRQIAPAIYQNNVQLVMLFLIFLLNIVAMKIVSLMQTLDYPSIGYVAPVAMGSILITILLNVNVAYFSAVMFGFMSSIIFNMNSEQLFDFRFGLLFIIVSYVAIFSIHQANRRSTIVRSGLLVSLFAVLVVSAMLLMVEVESKIDVLYMMGFAASGGVLTAILVIGLIPFFEAAFGILSPLKLLELSNPNHPLLRKLLTETPGTYHHSVMVGNLSEAAAESIGADGLLCRVGSFYHDIGKTKRPGYFIENQNNMENPHDRIDPGLSKSIIIAHARDGVDMLAEHKMPKAIRDIAEQHHGTTLLQYFYHKALKKHEGHDDVKILESDYRYPGPKAQTKEAAIVGIADSVEAAVRSLRNPTIEQIDTMVQKIIKSRLDDGQFNECDLTLKELDTIGSTLKETVLGIFHSRIEYPPDEEPGTESQSVGIKDVDTDDDVKGVKQA